jgi:hypothetical protein
VLHRALSAARLPHPAVSGLSLRFVSCLDFGFRAYVGFRASVLGICLGLILVKIANDVLGVKVPGGWK